MSKVNNPRADELSRKLSSGYWERVRDIRAQQSCQEFYSRYFSRHFSVFITAALSYTRVTPNQVTLTMVFWGFLGALLISQGSSFHYFLGGLSLMMLNVVDTVDGELARYLKKTTKGGDYLDRLAHYLTNSAAIVGMGVGMYYQYGILLLLMIAVIIEIIYTFDAVARDLLLTCGLATAKDGERKRVKIQTRIVNSATLFQVLQSIGTNMAFFHLLALFGLLDWLLIRHGLLMTDQFGFVATYAAFFALTTTLKLFIRIVKIKVLYF